MAAEVGTYVFGYENELGGVIFGISPVNTFDNFLEKKTTFDIQTGVNVESIQDCSAWGAGTNLLDNVFGSDNNIKAKVVTGEDGFSRIQGSFTLEAPKAKDYAALGLNCVIKLGAQKAENENVTESGATVTLPSSAADSTVTVNKKEETKSHSDLMVKRSTISASLAEKFTIEAGPDADGNNLGLDMTLSKLSADLVEGDSISLNFPFYSYVTSNGATPETRYNSMAAGKPAVEAACTVTVEGAEPWEALSQLVAFDANDLKNPESPQFMATMLDLQSFTVAPVSSSFLIIPVSGTIPADSTVHISCSKVTVKSAIYIKVGDRDGRREIPVRDSANLIYVSKYEPFDGTNPNVIHVQNSVQLKLRNHNSAFSAGAFTGAIVIGASLLSYFF